MGASPLVRVVRSGLEESVHRGHIAVCDARGRLLARVGDPDRQVFVRSCTKPLQAAVSLSVIGTTLPDRLVAVMCSSHNGEPVHVRAVRDLLALGDLSEDDLQNPPAWPLDPASRARVRVRRRVLHDCSGKHAGMLVACVRAGWPTATYRRRSHALQRRIMRAVRTVSGVQEVRVGVDGCGVPVHGMSLRSVATMYARFADPERLGPLAPWVGAATRAMLAEPYVVGGRARVDTAVMAAAEGVIAKEGAEALDCAVSLDAGVGVAVKVADGGYRAAGPALIRTLDLIGLLTPPARRALRVEAQPPVKGGGRRVGRLVADFELRRR
jgi:L-asparaginase II